MFKYFFIVFVIVLSINYSISVLDQSQVKPCVTMEYDAFMKNVKDITIKSVKVPKEITERFVAHINKTRAEFGKPPLVGDLLVAGSLVGGDVGLALFDNGCGVAQGIWVWRKSEDPKGYFERNGFMDIYNLIAMDDA
jgi:hypothetical protein